MTSMLRTAQRLPACRAYLLLVVVAAAMTDLACMDLKLPPARRDSAPETNRFSGEDSAQPIGRAQTGGQMGNGQGGSGGRFVNDAPELAEDVAGGGTGGIVELGSGGTGVLVTGAGGATGRLDVSAKGSGGVVSGTGGTSGIYGAEVGTAGGIFGTSDASVPDAPADATAAVPTNGLVAYYRCDQIEGTTLRDRSGNANNGTLLVATGTGGASGTGGVAGPGYKVEPGKIGNGLTLIQAGNGYVSLPPALFLGATNLTITVWIKLNTLVTWQRLFDVGVNAHLAANPMTGTSYLNLILKDLNGKLGLNATTDGYLGEQRITSEPIPQGAWKHVAVVLASGKATLYIDGSVVGMSSALPTLQGLGTIDYAYVGRSQFPGDPALDAEIDELRVYNRALSVGEVEAVFNFAGP
jgi:hypothetical protein